MINLPFFERLKIKEKAGNWTERKVKIGPILAAVLYILPGSLGGVRADNFEKNLPPQSKIVEVYQPQDKINHQFAQLDLRKLKIEDLIKIGVTIEAVKDLVNQSKEDKEAAKQALELTRKLNDVEAIRDFFKDRGGFSIDTKNIKVVSNSSVYYYSSLAELTKQALSLSLKPLGIYQVGSVQDIEKISRERKELRENPEVNQKKIPPPGTLEPPRYEANITILINLEQKDIEKSLKTSLGDTGFTSYLKYLEFFTELRKTKVVIILLSEFLDKHTNQKIQLISFGTPMEVEKMQNQMTRLYWRFRAENYKMEKEEIKIPLAILSTCDNLYKILKEEESQKEPEKREKSEVNKQEENVSRPILVASIVDLEKLYSKE
jgi:hypothetical protein